MKKFTFDVEKTVSYWAEAGEYDLEVAIAMLKAKKYPYTLFMGHLSLEKLLKADLGKFVPLRNYISASTPLWTLYWRFLLF